MRPSLRFLTHLGTQGIGAQDIVYCGQAVQDSPRADRRSSRDGLSRLWFQSWRRLPPSPWQTASPRSDQRSRRSPTLPSVRPPDGPNRTPTADNVECRCFDRLPFGGSSIWRPRSMAAPIGVSPLLTNSSIGDHVPASTNSVIVSTGPNVTTPIWTRRDANGSALNSSFRPPHQRSVPRSVCHALNPTRPAARRMDIAGSDC